MPIAHERRKPFIIWLLTQLLQSPHTSEEDKALVEAALDAALKRHAQRTSG